MPSRKPLSNHTDVDRMLPFPRRGNRTNDNASSAMHICNLVFGKTKTKHQKDPHHGRKICVGLRPTSTGSAGYCANWPAAGRLQSFVMYKLFGGRPEPLTPSPKPPTCVVVPDAAVSVFEMPTERLLCNEWPKVMDSNRLSLTFANG